MDFDLLVRKYLRGTLSDEELQRLRHLLATVPEYRNELRQILDLRSVIHDDALRLDPPKELSERTRILVGSRFAGIEALLQGDAGTLVPPRELADATFGAVASLFAADPMPIPAGIPADDSDRKRRALIIPLRYAFSGLAAAVIATFVVLGPRMVNTISSTDVPRAGTTSAPSTPRQPRAVPAPARSAGRIDAAVVARAESSGGASPAAVAASVPRPVSVSTTSADALATASSSVIEPTERSAEASAAIPTLPEAPLVRSVPEADSRASDGTALRNSQPTLSSGISGGGDPQPIPVVTAYEEMRVPHLGPRNRLMTVGVTIGSGGVIEHDAPTPILQNSYYLSFSLGENDRIGVEMGGSTFMQDRQVPERRTGPSIFGKGQSSDDTTRSATLVSTGATPTMVSQRAPEEITYGGVFYDRRLPVDRSWDLCGRITFGAADGALVGGFRAYAAYSPSPDVTLTLGVGGSTLYNLNRKGDPASLNYGLYYGIETGF